MDSLIRKTSTDVYEIQVTRPDDAYIYLDRSALVRRRNLAHEVAVDTHIEEDLHASGAEGVPGAKGFDHGRA